MVGAAFLLGVTDVSSPNYNQELVRSVVAQMQKLGHAIQYDDAVDSSGKFLSARVTHFLTCRPCNEVK